MESSWLTPARRRMFVQCLVVLHVLVFAVMAQYKTAAALKGSDAQRYAEIAAEVGRLGGAAVVEYPPVAVLGMRALGNDLPHLALGLLAANLVADLVIAGVLAAVWSRRSAVVYLVLAAPLLAFFESGFDLVVTALAVVGLACVVKDRERVGGLVLAFAVFVKFWPVVFVLLLWAIGRRRAAITQAIGVGLGGVAWVAYAGVRGPIDVLTFRGATGWHVESIAGWFVAVVRNEASRYEQGSWRVGHPSAVWGALLTLAMLVGAAGVAVLLRRTARATDRSGAHADATVVLGSGAVALIGTTMVFATLLSPQYVAWLLPFVALTAAHSRPLVPQLRAVLHAGIAVVVTSTVYVATTALNQPDPLAAHLKVAARNVSLVWLVLAATRSLYCVAQACSTASTTSENGSPLTSTTTDSMVAV